MTHTEVSIHICPYLGYACFLSRTHSPAELSPNLSSQLTVNLCQV
jgi:hypothetical protein